MVDDRFPKDWKKKKLSDVGFSYSGLKSKSKKDFDEDGNAQFVTYRNINRNYFVDKHDLSFVQVEEDENQNHVLKGDVLFTSSSETPEEVAFSSVMKEEIKNLYLNSFSFGYRFNNPKEFLPEFYGYYFRGPNFRKNVFPLAQGSTRYNLSKNEVLKIDIPVPSFKEQQKIASILSSVDEAIEKTKQIIEQTETIKKRLIDQLSTNGLGHKNYKRTMIGDIPVNWKISTIHEHLTDYKSGASIKSNEFVEEGVKVLPKKAINSSGSVKESNFNLSYISNEVAKQYSKSLINNEYLITVLRDLVPSGPSIGRVSKITNDEQYVMAQGVYAFKLQQTLDSNFMIHLSNSRIFRKQILAKKVGSTQVHLRREEFFNTLIPLPSLDEQIKIASIIDNFDKKITLEKDKLEYLICTKKGLMQQLLTGKVRVPTTESEEVPQ